MNSMIKFLIIFLLALFVGGCEMGTLFQDTNTPTVTNDSNNDTDHNTNTNNNADNTNTNTDNTINNDKDNTNNTDNTNNDNTPDTTNDYSYIPKGSDLTYAKAYKFLNMATFGATPELVKELQQKGVVSWLDEQLSMKYDDKDESILRKVIKNMITYWPEDYGKVYNHRTDITLEEYLADNDVNFNQGWGKKQSELAYHSSAIFQGALDDKAQVRQRVAYALSQIIIASESNDQFFVYKGEALSFYYDVLLKYAFDSYSTLLYKVSLTPAMSTYLTYNGNEKKHIDTKTGATVFPDENYGREIMQLFSIGLYELNIDGTEQRGPDGKRVPTYVQEDVNNISRVFTGFDYPHSEFGRYFQLGDATHELVCYEQYHDTGAKKFLDETIPANKSCLDDMKATIDILIQNKNTAPHISKKLIQRFTNSTPNSDYIKRVATVFRDTNGDLKAVIKAVLLDKSVWDNIDKDKAAKIKEPFIVLTNVLRALHVQPYGYMLRGIRLDKTTSVQRRLEGPVYFIKNKYPIFGQWPTFSPTVFNFYGDDFVPDDEEFKIRGFFSPEAEILTTKFITGTTNYYRQILRRQDKDTTLYQYGITTMDEYYGLKHNESDYYIISYDELYPIFEKLIGDKDYSKFQQNSKAQKAKIIKDAVPLVVDKLSIMLLGKTLDEKFRSKLIEHYQYARFRNHSNTHKAIKADMVTYIFSRMAGDIILSDYFMVN